MTYVHDMPKHYNTHDVDSYHSAVKAPSRRTPAVPGSGALDLNETPGRRDNDIANGGHAVAPVAFLHQQ